MLSAICRLLSFDLIHSQTYFQYILYALLCRFEFDYVVCAYDKERWKMVDGFPFALMMVMMTNFVWNAEQQSTVDDDDIMCEWREKCENKTKNTNEY